MTLAEAKERIRRLEKIVGESPSENVPEIAVMCVTHGERILTLQQTVTDIWKDVEVQVNGKYVRALLDTGADSNYLAQHMVDRLGLTLSKCSKQVKAVNLGTVAMLGETEIEGKEANSAREKHNETLERGQCLAALGSKSEVVAESVGLVDELQSSMASSSGLVKFQGKLGDCSSLGRGPKQQMKHEGSVTVGQMQCKIDSSESLGEGMTHRRQRVSMVGGPSSEKGKNS
ncbi:hypothetical protein ACOSP7_004083 [Xanthoceras sorbifolium]